MIQTFGALRLAANTPYADCNNALVICNLRSAIGVIASLQILTVSYGAITIAPYANFPGHRSQDAAPVELFMFP